MVNGSKRRQDHDSEMSGGSLKKKIIKKPDYLIVLDADLNRLKTFCNAQIKKGFGEGP